MLIFLLHNNKKTLSFITKSYNTNSLLFLMMTIFLVFTIITILIINFSVYPMFDCCRRRCRKSHCLQQIYQHLQLLITRKKEIIHDNLFRKDFIKQLSVNFSMKTPVEICELSSYRCQKNHPFFPPFSFLERFWSSLWLYARNFIICLYNVQYSTMSVTLSISSYFSNNFIFTLYSLKFVIIDLFKHLEAYNFFQSSQHVFNISF